jgi:hypothetical protein
MASGSLLSITGRLVLGLGLGLVAGEWRDLLRSFPHSDAVIAATVLDLDHRLIPSVPDKSPFSSSSVAVPPSVPVVRLAFIHLHCTSITCQNSSNSQS